MAKNDYEALGGMACYASRPREECPYRNPERRDAWLRGWDDANRTRRLRAEQSVRAQIREVEARVARTLAAVESDRELIATLTADADRMALEHERPHGIRGLADRWAAARDRPSRTEHRCTCCGGQASEENVCAWCGTSGVNPFDMRDWARAHAVRQPLTDDELDDLLRWVHREMAREVERRAALRREHAASVYGWVGARELWDGENDNDREALTDHIGGLLGGAFANGDGKATAVAWALYDAAGRP